MITAALAALLSASPAAAAVAEGQPAPAFKLRTLDGALVRLDERAYPGKEKAYAKKRPVFLDFFRTDCGPCRVAIPELVELHAKWKDRGLEVYLVALLEPQDGRAKLEAFLKEHKLPFVVLVDDTEHFAKKFLGSSVALPSTFLIDREGIVRRTKQGGKGSMLEHFGDALASVTEQK